LNDVISSDLVSVTSLWHWHRCTLRWAWGTASCGSVSGSGDWLHMLCKCEWQANIICAQMYYFSRRGQCTNYAV